jgi:hypothetical protein
MLAGKKHQHIEEETGKDVPQSEEDMLKQVAKSGACLS